jgi:hypothetical protein
MLGMLVRDAVASLAGNGTRWANGGADDVSRRSQARVANLLFWCNAHYAKPEVVDPEIGTAKATFSRAALKSIAKPAAPAEYMTIGRGARI